MFRSMVVGTVLLALISVPVMADDDPVFSGPQAGEKLGGFTFRHLPQNGDAEDIDIVSQADGEPVLVIFVHALTRPSIGLTRAIADYAAKRKEPAVHSAVVFLTKDVTETEARIKRARHAMPKNSSIGVYTKGEEGPGSYGLNRNVTLTILVGKDGKVTDNFALVQPSLEADAVKIATAVIKATGGDETPKLAQIAPQAAMRKPAAAGNVENLRPLIAPVIQKTATKEQVDKAAAKLEEFAAKNPAAKKQIGDIARRIVNAGVLENYGTEAAQAYIKKWSEEFK